MSFWNQNDIELTWKLNNDDFGDGSNESLYGYFRFQRYRYLIDSLVTLPEDDDGVDDRGWLGIQILKGNVCEAVVFFNLMLLPRKAKYNCKKRVYLQYRVNLHWYSFWYDMPRCVNLCQKWCIQTGNKNEVCLLDR